ncbi:hypothetical protein AB0958_18125 [Streptomyces sp. NPDC006655]|uniref:hypothetical protein n=1 Tax=Streptomyces sp. NPDC006655 TaxID=3156898 RepID=UPI00345310D6
MSESPNTELASQYGERIQQDLDLNAAEQERLGAEIAALEGQLRELRENRVVLDRLRQALAPQAGATAPDAAEGAEAHEADQADQVDESPASSEGVEATGASDSDRSADAPASASAGDAKAAEVTVAVVPRQKTGSASSGAADSGSGKASSGTAGRGKAGSGKAGSGKAGPRKASPRKVSSRKAKTDEATPAEAPAAEATPAEAKPSLVDAVRTYLEQQREPRSAVEVAEAIRSGQPGRTIKTTVIRTTLESLVARNLAQRSKQGRSVFYTSTAAAQDTP